MLDKTTTWRVDETHQTAWVQIQKTSGELEHRVHQFQKKFVQLMQVVSTNHQLSKNIASQSLAVANHLPASMRSAAEPTVITKVIRVKLTPRQTEVVRLISLGCTMSEIGLILNISESTADNTRTRAMKRLGVTKAALVTRVALIQGITSPMDHLTFDEIRKGRIHGDGWN